MSTSLSANSGDVGDFQHFLLTKPIHQHSSEIENKNSHLRMVVSHWSEQGNTDSSSQVMNTSLKKTKADHPMALNLSAAARHSVIRVANSLYKTQICTTISARDLPKDKSQRAAVDIIIALDVSTRDKLALCKRSSEVLLHSLHPGDSFGLVSFSDEAVIEVPIHEYFVRHKEITLRHIKSLRMRHGTNMSAAIRLATQEMQTVLSPNPVHTIFLLSDGLANRGIASCRDFVQLGERHCIMNELIANGAASETLCGGPPLVMTALPEATEEEPKDSCISLHCFGYGSDQDSHALQSISQAIPGGCFNFVQDDSSMHAAFSDALRGVCSVVAQNAVLHIEVPTELKALGVEIVDVYHKNKVERKGKSYSVAMDDFYAEEHRDIFFEVTLVKNSPITAKYRITHATVSLLYTDTLSTRRVSCPPKHCDIARIRGRAISATNTHVKVQWSRIRAIESIQKADKLTSCGNLEDARDDIDSVTREIHRLTDEVWCDPLVKQLIADLDCIKKGLVSPKAYAQYRTHRMQKMMESHETQGAWNPVA